MAGEVEEAVVDVRVQEVHGENDVGEEGVGLADLDVEGVLEELEVKVVIPASAGDWHVLSQLLQPRPQLCVRQVILQVCHVDARVGHELELRPDAFQLLVLKKVRGLDEAGELLLDEERQVLECVALEELQGLLCQTYISGPEYVVLQEVERPLVQRRVYRQSLGEAVEAESVAETGRRLFAYFGLGLLQQLLQLPALVENGAPKHHQAHV